MWSEPFISLKMLVKGATKTQRFKGAGLIDIVPPLARTSRLHLSIWIGVDANQAPITGIPPAYLTLFLIAVGKLSDLYLLQ
jgi:hypothetical protein